MGWQLPSGNERQTIINSLFNVTGLIPAMKKKGGIAPAF